MIGHETAMPPQLMANFDVGKDDEMMMMAVTWTWKKKVNNR